VAIESLDMTVAIIRLLERSILIASVYVLGFDLYALRDTYNKLRKAIKEVRRKVNTAVEMVVVGDFNRYDQRWGGDDVSVER